MYCIVSNLYKQYRILKLKYKKRGGGEKCRSALAWVNMVNAQEIVVGMVMGELTLYNLYYVQGVPEKTGL